MGFIFEIVFMAEEAIAIKAKRVAGNTANKTAVMYGYEWVKSAKILNICMMTRNERISQYFIDIFAALLL